MKKSLIILWIIIIGGGAFIGLNYEKLFKNKTTLNPENKINLETPTKEQPNPITENPEPKIQVTQKNYESYISSGDTHFVNKEYAQAIANYIPALEINPENIGLFAKLGESYLKNNEPEKAKDTFKKAQTLDPNSVFIKLGIARSYMNLRNIEEAKKLILEMDQTNNDVKLYKGIVSLLYTNFEEAKKLFKEISSTKLANGEENPTVAKAKKFDNVFNLFSSFKEGDPLYLETLLAKALTEIEEYEVSIPLLYDVISKKSNYRDAWIVLGYAYLNTGKIADSIDSFSQAESISPDKPETLFFLGLAYFANDNFDRAIYYLEKADKAGFEPKDQISLKLGDLYLLKQKYKKSAEKYEKVLELNTSNINIFAKTVWLNIEKLDQADHALEIASNCLTYYPEKAMSYNLVGWAYAALNRFDEAETYLKKALAMDPNLNEATLNMGYMYERQGLKNFAQEFYKKAYLTGQGSSVSNVALVRYKALTDSDKNQYYQINISSPKK